MIGAGSRRKLVVLGLSALGWGGAVHGQAPGVELVPLGGVPGSIRFSSASYTVQEFGGTATITLQRTGGDDGSVSVNFATSNASAISGLDYTSVVTTVSWADNDDDPKTVQVPILNDNLPEGSETVSLSLSAPTGGATLTSPSNAGLTIFDDDSGAGACVSDANTLCLLGGRFEARIQFRTAQGQQGPGLANPIRDFSGAFSFFNPDNLEMLLKVIDGCALNNRFWVFYAATTNVEFVLTVRDKENPSAPVKTYVNNLNNPAPPIQDTNAFTICP